MSFLISWIVLAFAFWVTAMILPGFKVRGFGSAIIIAAIFGVLNFLLNQLFFVVFSIATLGIAYLLAFITRWVITAILLKITDVFTDRLKIDGFGYALLGALLISVIGTFGEWIVRTAFSM